jgi:hypothetical protein
MPKGVRFWSRARWEAAVVMGTTASATTTKEMAAIDAVLMLSPVEQ